MASAAQVREFLAHWFQLGKPVVMGTQGEPYLPQPVYTHGRYSLAFEQCWQCILQRQGQDCYLQGTVQTVAMMLSADWDIIPCARCTMPIIAPTAGVATAPCPCSDLESWPNLDVPTPRHGVDSQAKLAFIRERLALVKAQQDAAKREAYDPDDTNVFSSWREMS